MDLRRKTPLQTYPWMVNTEDHEYFYDGTGSIVTNVLKGMISNLVPVSSTTIYNANVNQSVGMTSSLYQPHVNLKVNNKLYGGGWSRWRYVLSDPDNDLNNWTASNFENNYPGGDYISDAVHTPWTNSIYYLTGQRIFKVEIDNFTSESVIYNSGAPINLGGAGTLPAIKASGSFLYVATATTPPILMKINVDTGVVSQNVTWTDPLFNGNIVRAHASAISTDQKWVYFGSPGGTTGGAICKVSTEDITNYTSSGPIWKYIGTNPVISSSFDLTDDMCYLKGYVYAATEAGLTSGSEAIYGYNLKINADTLLTSSDNRMDGIGNSFGIFTDGVNIYKCINTEGTCIYLNGDLNSPRRFTYTSASATSIPSPNEMWFTDGGKIIVSNWPSSGSGISWVSFPISKIGIDTVPAHSLDIAGGVFASEYANSPNISTTTIKANTIVFTSSIQLSNITTFRVQNSGRLTTTSSITASAGISCPPNFKTITQFYSGSADPTSSIAIKAANTNNYFVLSVWDNGDTTGTLTITRQT